MSTKHADAFPGVVEIVVEIPRGSRNKYEYDEEARVYRLDRVLSSAVFYNFDYGFIESTRADDGDHTDALLIIDEPTFTGCHVWGGRSAASRCATSTGSTSRPCASRSVTRTSSTSSASTRCGRTASSRSSTSSTRTSCSRTRRSTSPAGGTATSPSRCSPSDRERYRAEVRVAERPDRLFVAVPMPPEPLAACRALVDGVRAGPSATCPRWVHVDNLHLTVRFLGETPPELTPDAALAVRDALAGAHGVRGRARRRRLVPEARKPRALWLGIEQGAAELGALADALDPALEPLGWPRDDRPYRPHLTVARLDRSSIAPPRPLRTSCVPRLRAGAPGSARTASSFFRSHLGGGPPRYEPLVEIPLAAAERAPRGRTRPAPATGATLAAPPAAPARHPEVPPRWPPSFLAGPSSSSTRTGSRGPGTTSRPTCRCRRRRRSTRGRASRSARPTSRRCSRWRSSCRRSATEREIEIPDPVREAYQLYRPRPCIRAHRLEKALDTPAHIYYKYEGVSPAGSHKPNTALAAGLLQQAGGRQAPGDRDRRRPVGERPRLRRRRLRARGQGLHGPGELRPEAVPPDPHGDLRRVGGAEPQPGHQLRPGGPGRDAGLAPARSGMAISEAVEDAATRDDTKYALGSVLNHVLLHQTVIGQEAIEQMELAGEEPGRHHRLRRRRLELRRAGVPVRRAASCAARRSYRVIAAEPEAAPSLTRGVYAYDFGDTGHDDADREDAHPRLATFIPEPIHAGGLRYHGMSPLVSLLKEHGLIEARSVHQRACFEAGVQFARDRGHPARRPRAPTRSGSPSTRRSRPGRRASSG